MHRIITAVCSAKLSGVILLLFSIVSMPSSAEAPRVLVSIKPLHGLAAGVLAGVAEPELLLSGNASPHSFVFRPSDARKLQRADLVVWVGENLESFLRQPLATAESSSRVLSLVEEPTIQLLRFDDEGHSHSPAVRLRESGPLPAATANLDVKGAAGRNFDPHLWLDPGNAAVIVDALVRELSDLDPGNRSSYLENGARTKEKITALDELLQVRLAPLRGVPFLVYHDAFRYFTDHYGLKMVGAVTDSAAREAGVKRMLDIKRKIRSSGARCLFAEPQSNAASVDNIAREAGLRSGLLDPLGVGIEPGPDAWFEIMAGITNSLGECLGVAKRNSPQ